MVVVAGFGNPLLDITATLTDDNLLHDYNLNEDDQTVIDEGQMKSLLSDISTFPVEYSPGGCAQNTIRVMQWLLNEPNSTLMFGAVGDDKQGRNLKTLVENAGVQTRYVISKDKPTGTSVALVKHANRSLVAYTGAAETINVENFNDVTKNGEMLNNVDLFYMEGFFLPKRKEVAVHILKCGKERGIPFAFNISAPYICKRDPETVKYFAENCDIMFGNRKEYEALCDVFNVDRNAKDLAVHLSKIKAKSLTKYGKIVAVTNGAKSVFCVHSGGILEEMNVPAIDPLKLKDTTGAGDSFVAGFLTALFSDRPPNVCLAWGCWTAQQIIQQVGCKIPEYSAKIADTV